MSESSGSGGQHEQRRGALGVIAVFKLVKGVILLLVALGAMRLFHHDTRESLAHWMEAFRFEPGKKYTGWLIGQLGQISDRRVEELGIATFLYAGVFLTEGVGLLLRKRWAEYLTVIATGSFLPIEVYELAHRFSAPRVLTLVVNLAVVIYLIVRLWRERHQKGTAGAQPAASPG